MSRTRLAGCALLFLAFLPGCGTLTGDRRTLCERWQDFWGTNRYEACPVGYPVAMDAGCPTGGCATPIPPYGGAPIHMGLPGADTFPPPGGAQTMPPRIPKGSGGAVDESKGKQFDPDQVNGRTSPIGPALPTSGTK